MTMRRQIGIGAVLGLLAFCALAGWRTMRTPGLPGEPSRPLADMGAVKSDLLTYARAERAFYASTGHYATMDELRSKGLLSVPPDVRWPYFYSIHTPAPDRFVIIAMAQGPFGSRPIAVTIDDNFNMRQFDPHRWRHPEHRRAAPVRFS